MMINELPRNTMDIATTYFEDPKIQSQFKKDMDNNMKMLSGVDPVVSNEELSNQINTDNNTLLDNGTADAMLVRNDRESLELLTQNMEIMGTMARTNPKISAADYYTQTEMANRAAIDDIYRINLTNSKDDPRIYSTKSMIGFEKIAEALDGLKPNYVRNTVRYLGQPALSLGLAVYTKGKAAPFTDAGMAGWDAIVLGDTIYNVQENYNQRYYDILNNPSLTLEQFEEEMGNLVKDIQIKVAPEYQFEVLNGLVEGPNPFADAGLSFTSLGVRIATTPAGFLAKMARKALPFKQGMSLKRMQMNQDLTEKIRKSITNSVDESVVDDNIASEVAAIAPKDTKQEDIDTVKGLMKNEINDDKLLSNSNNDFSYFDRLLRGLSGADEKTGSNQRGEIKLERPEQSYFIDHGKGVDGDQPLTFKEAVALQKKLQGRANPITPWKGGKHGLTQYFEYNPDIEPELIGIQSASKTGWTNDINKPGKWGYKEHQGEGAGDEWFFGGGYGSSIDSPWIAALKYYYKDNEPTEVQKIDDIINRFHKDYLSDEEFSKARKMFDKDNYIYQKFLDNERVWKEEDEAVESATKSLRNNMERKYSIVKFLKDIGAKDETINRVVDIENKFRGFNNDDIFQPNLIVDDIKQGLDEGPEHFNTIDSPDQLKQQIFKLSSDYKKLIKNIKEEFPDRDLDTLIELYKDHFKKHDGYLPHSVEFSEFVNNLAFFNHQVIAEEFYKHLKSIMTAEDFVPKTAHLQTLGDINPMKNPEGIFYYDNERGLIPFAELFNRANTEENYNKLLKIIQSDNAILDSIEKDAAEGMIKKYGYSNYSTSQKEEITENFINDMKSNRDRKEHWRFKLENFVLPFDKNKQIATDKNYNAWERDYLERKGVKRVWHNGGASQSFNLSIQNFEDLTPVILEETGIDTPWYRAIAHDNAHPIVSAGDGVGYFVRELHGVEGAKPMIVGKGYKVLDMGDYKPYNK